MANFSGGAQGALSGGASAAMMTSNPALIAGGALIGGAAGLFGGDGGGDFRPEYIPTRGYDLPSLAGTTRLAELAGMSLTAEPAVFPEGYSGHRGENIPDEFFRDLLPGETAFNPRDFGIGKSLQSGRFVTSPIDSPPISIDDSFITSPEVRGTTAFDDVDLNYPDSPVNPPRITPPMFPGEPVSRFSTPLLDKLLSGRTGLDENRLEYLSQIGDLAAGTSSVRGVIPSAEGFAKVIAPELEKFRSEDISQLIQAEASDRQNLNIARRDSIEAITNIYGTEVAQRATDIASNNENFRVQVEKVTRLRESKAQAETQLEGIRVGAETERQRLTTQIKIAEIDANLKKEEIQLQAAALFAEQTKGFHTTGGGAAGGGGGIDPLTMAMAMGSLRNTPRGNINLQEFDDLATSFITNSNTTDTRPGAFGEFNDTGEHLGFPSRDDYNGFSFPPQGP